MSDGRAVTYTNIKGRARLSTQLTSTRSTYSTNHGTNYQQPQANIVFSAVNSHIPNAIASSCHVSVNGLPSEFAAVSGVTTRGGTRQRPIIFAIPTVPMHGYDIPQKLSSETTDAIYQEYLTRYAEEIGITPSERVLHELQKELPKRKVLFANNWKTQGSKTDEIIATAKPQRRGGYVSLRL